MKHLCPFLSKVVLDLMGSVLRSLFLVRILLKMTWLREQKISSVYSFNQVLFLFLFGFNSKGAGVNKLC